jgi:hygromycin-B 4-O-kinase
VPEFLSPEQAQLILSGQFSAPVTDLAALMGGEVSQVFVFSVAGERYVGRFGHPVLLDAFEKEAMIARRVLVPVPEVVRMGRTPDHSFAVSRFAAGRPLGELAAAPGLTESLMQTLDTIHQTDLRGWRAGWGTFDGRGVGRSPSWSQHLLKVREEEPPGSYFGAWHRLFRESFLEREVFDRLFARMESLLGLVPEVRHLVHGDYGFSNVLAEAGCVSAVLDWANALYGDFLYDVARLQFFSPREDYAELFRAHYSGGERLPPHYDERLLCYCCHIALEGLRFYAHTGQREPYDWCKARALELSG